MTSFVAPPLFCCDRLAVGDELFGDAWLDSCMGEAFRWSPSGNSSFWSLTFLCRTKTTEDNDKFTFPPLFWWPHEAERAQTGTCRPRVFVSGDNFNLFKAGFKAELAKLLLASSRVAKLLLLPQHGSTHGVWAMKASENKLC